MGVYRPLIPLRTKKTTISLDRLLGEYERFRWIGYLESMNVKVLKEEQVWTAIDVGVVDFEY